ncbi:hypothetical protein [Algoriphagus sp. AK58]|uniref:hypothetical protein n=1 Tax=Algoriphagus sp. AK58 TaxID=1406877 RepID=UPI001650C583|nr:hypothetical protein [Algoriphagus sp. AK58]MBC6368571.1 hypothetical protein [Algoriphagus sp. AK58]
MKVCLLALVFSTFFSISLSAQEYPSYDSLKRAVTSLEKDLYQVKLNLHNSQKQLQNGILVATLGYTVTIIGGQLLGTNPELGETLLYVGGATGIAGTVILFKGFKKISLGPPPPKRY